MTAFSERQRPLRVAVDARVSYGESGGVEQFVVGLAYGLSSLKDGDEQYDFLTHPGKQEWLEPYLAGRARAVPLAHSGDAAVLTTFARRVTSAVRSRVGRFVPMSLSRRLVPRSSGFVESRGYDLIHFTKQDAFLTSIPSIYHPHDLQHLHLPEFFSPAQLRHRNVRYRAFCDSASLVAVGSTWCREDIIRHLNVPPRKVAVVPLAPIIEAIDVPAAIDRPLPESFIFYPAQTWPHKNHVALLDALAVLRDSHGLSVPLVCSGRMNEHFEVINSHARHLGLTGQVTFLGFVTDRELKGLYSRARCVVIPTLFEAGSFPMWEAFKMGVPVAASAVTSLPRQAGGSALMFDPFDVRDLASAIHRLWTDADLRERLVAAAHRRVEEFTWERTARLFRAHYRRLSGRELAADEIRLLEEEPSI